MACLKKKTENIVVRLIKTAVKSLQEIGADACSLINVHLKDNHSISTCQQTVEISKTFIVNAAVHSGLACGLNKLFKKSPNTSQISQVQQVFVITAICCQV